MGRTTQLERFYQALQELDERGTALLVMREPGIGKTASLMVIAEDLQWLDRATV